MLEDRNDDVQLENRAETRAKQEKEKKDAARRATNLAQNLKRRTTQGNKDDQGGLQPEADFLEIPAHEYVPDDSDDMMDSSDGDGSGSGTSGTEQSARTE